MAIDDLPGPVVRDGGTAQEPTGLVRRVHTRPLPTDESIGNDLGWHSTDYLERYYVLGSTDREHVEITAELAVQLLERWRAQADARHS